MHEAPTFFLLSIYACLLASISGHSFILCPGVLQAQHTTPPVSSSSSSSPSACLVSGFGLPPPPELTSRLVSFLAAFFFFLSFFDFFLVSASSSFDLLTPVTKACRCCWAAAGTTLRPLSPAASGTFHVYAKVYASSSVFGNSSLPSRAPFSNSDISVAKRPTSSLAIKSAASSKSSGLSCSTAS